VTGADEVYGAGSAPGIPTPKGPPWTYVLAHESWYAPACGITTPVIDVHHEAYKPNGARDGVEWQFEIRWLDGRILVDYAEFEDAVQIERPILYAALGDLPASATFERVVGLLRAYGFTDTTDRDRPDWLRAPA
jgi:hypothetical protein